LPLPNLFPRSPNLERRRAFARASARGVDCGVRTNRRIEFERNYFLHGEGQIVDSWDEKRRKRYADDPDYRAKLKTKSRAYYETHKEEVNERRRRKRRENRLSERGKRLRQMYGISLQDHDAMLAKQGGVCGICKQPPTELLCVDHCHATERCAACCAADATPSCGVMETITA
jgi:hypothetical protein